MKTGYKTGDCMTIHPITVSKDTKLSDCAKLMAEKHIGSLLVADKGKILGLVTEQDFVRKGIVNNLDFSSATVNDIMVTELMSITPDKDVYDALKMMRDYNIRHLPVLDRGQLVGFLTIKDILKIQPQLFDLIAEKIELREASRKPIAEDDEGLCDGCGAYSTDLEDVDGSMLCTGCRNNEGKDKSGDEDEEEMF